MAQIPDGFPAAIDVQIEGPDVAFHAVRLRPTGGGGYYEYTDGLEYFSINFADEGDALLAYNPGDSIFVEPGVAGLVGRFNLGLVAPWDGSSLPWEITWDPSAEQPGTTYVGYTDGGWGDGSIVTGWSAEIIYAGTDTTSAGILSAVGVTQTTVTMEWTQAFNQDPFATITQTLQRSVDFENWFPVAGTSPTTDTGLTAGTTYHYRIFADDNNGNQGTSNVVTVTTDAPTPPPATHRPTYNPVLRFFRRKR